MMKKSALLFLFALTLTLSLLSSGREALAASPGPSFQASASLCPACEARCLRACLDAFKDDLEDAKSRCIHCSFSVLGICVARTADPQCFKRMREMAEDVYDACAAACKRPEPKPERDPKPLR